MRQTPLSDKFSELRKRARHDPVWFAREILRLKTLDGEKTLDEDPELSWEMDEWQVELLEAAGDVVRKKEGVPTIVNHEGLNMITVRSMHGPGKTFGVACLLHWFGFCFRGVMPCTAPKLKQVKTRLWKEFRRVRSRALPGYSTLMKVDAEQITWAGSDPKEPWDMDHRAFGETAAAPENLAGLHDRYMLFVVDEASGVNENLWPAVFGAMSAGYLVILVLISNPTRREGTFADSHLKAAVRKNYHRIHISLDKTKRVKRSWVKQMEDQYGKKSPVVRIRCYGEFADADPNQLISLAWLEDAGNRERAPDGSFPRLRVSVDVADGGEAMTVVTVCRHYSSFSEFVQRRRYSFPQAVSSIRAADVAEETFIEFGGRKEDSEDDLVVDELGVGAGTAGTLIDREYPVVTYRGGERSDDTKKWRNRRTQSYLCARDDLRDGKVVILDGFCEEVEWDDFVAQMCSVRTKPGDERVEDLETKEHMMARGVKSPDDADSWAMQYATQEPVQHSTAGVYTIGGSYAERCDAGLT